MQFGTQTGETDTHSRTDATDWQVQLRQTVFRWDQWVRYRQADKQVLQADVDYRVAELDLYTRVADAYFNVLAAEDTLAAKVAAREAIGRQLEQAQKRFEVGLIAITDVQEAQSGYDQAVAAEILAKRQLANSKEVLREIVGDYPGELAKPKDEIPLISPGSRRRESVGRDGAAAELEPAVGAAGRGDCPRQHQHRPLRPPADR